ncbi:MAG: hypothetical protein ACKVU2_01175, partial [Saprospiraceae bacterium]
GQPEETAKYFEQGFAVLPHHLRIGRDVASLYRGPLMGGAEPALPVAFALPVESADALLLYDQKSGMLDVSYAAAWTLGRQLALEDRAFALDLYKFKRRQAIKSNRTTQTVKAGAGSVAHLAIGKNATAEDDPLVQGRITKWLKQYETLQNIPFHYLVPQENLLPEESIRFFRLAPRWIATLQHGALGVGGDFSGGKAIVPTKAPDRWGFFLRSRVVMEFPKLRIEGFSTRKTNQEDRSGPIAPSEVRKMNENILLVLFDSTIQTVDIFLDPSNLYFGFKEEAGDLFKDLKNTDGSEITAQNVVRDIKVDAAHWRNAQTRILNVDVWAKRMRDQLLASTGNPEFNLFTSADFALQMIEGAPRVRFFVE